MNRRKHHPAKRDFQREKRLLILLGLSAALMLAFTVWISL